MSRHCDYSNTHACENEAGLRHFIKHGEIRGCVGCCPGCLNKDTCEYCCAYAKKALTQVQENAPAAPTFDFSALGDLSGQAEQEEKASSLRLVYRDCIGELEPLISFDRLLVPQWLNKTFDLARASKELRLAVETRREELRLIRDTCGEDAEACTTEYLRAFSVNDALHEHQRRQDARAAQAEAEARRQAAERAKAAAPVAAPPSEEERQVREEARQAAQSNAFVTASGRLDCEVLQQFAQPAAPARKRYKFWVEFTPEDIAWFKQGAAERGFRYGSVK